jgi:hypothetical protein
VGDYGDNMGDYGDGDEDVNLVHILSLYSLFYDNLMA